MQYNTMIKFLCQWGSYP
ncbi:MAG: hypothetical protein EA361_18235 [Bacteroidetes bacterium]|nr:MAG: hypothetical protein EA361_18235 [Bacteroidota bacterium]